MLWVESFSDAVNCFINQFGALLIRVYENFSVLAVQLMSATCQKALCKPFLVPFFN